MAEIDVQTLRDYELRLLRCTLPSQPSIKHHSLPSQSQPIVDHIITLIESGQYVDSLSSTAAQTIFQFSESFESLNPTQFYDELERAVESYLINDASEFKFILVVSVAVAAFLAFLQCNFTGPVIDLPTVPLPWKEVKEGKEWDAWARIQLMSAGSDLAAKFSNLQYIMFAKILLMKTRDLSFGEKTVNAAGLGTCTWWFARLILLHQRILDEHCSSLLDLLHVFMGESLNHFGNVEKVKGYWGASVEEEEALTIVSMLQLEAGLFEHTFGRVDPARQYFGAAALSVGLELSVTGALGLRTVHQVEPKAQMVLVANRSFPSSCNSPLESGSHERDTSGDSNSHHSETSDVLIAPKFVDSCGNGTNGVNVVQHGCTTDGTLTAIQQAVVLAQGLLKEKSARLDELQRWEMAPYLEAIDSQQSSCFTIKCSCNILRIKWESTRSRTKERALLMMDKVVQDLYVPSPQVPERVHSCFAVYLPAVPILRKEYGELLISRGLISEALKIFEDLELWDNLIYCYRLLEKKAAAVELIKARLQEKPTDPRLWCSLGDVTNDESCYDKALEVSNHRSARAMRSLARNAYNRGEYERSTVLWESAMALNSIYPDGWFALGAAALKARDVNKALGGFTRAVTLDPDNGEAWNNIACLHMIKKKSEEAVIAFKEALKFKRNSWQMWENYGQVSADVGNYSQNLYHKKLAPETNTLCGRLGVSDLRYTGKLVFFQLNCSGNTGATPSNSGISYEGVWDLSRIPVYEHYTFIISGSKYVQVNERVDSVGTLESQALEAAQMVLDLTGNKRYDGDLLEKMVQELEKRFSSSYSTSTASDKDCNKQTVSSPELAESRETQRLMELLGKVLQQVVRTVGSGDIWGLYARWNKMRGDLTMCSEALLKQVRSYQGSEVWKDSARFRKYANASLELCKIYVVISSSTGSFKELHAADMHLRNTIKQASSFKDTEEFKALQVCLNEVQMKLESKPVPTS